MMERRRAVPWGAICIAIWCAIAAAPVDAQTTLRITLQLPLTSPLGANLVAFKENVEVASAGALRIEIYPSAQLFTDKEVPVAVASGQIEMGVSSLARFAGTIPAVDVFFVPFLFNTPELVTAATAPGAAVRGLIDAALIEKGARPLWWQPYGLTVLMTRGVQVRVPDDMRGLKIRTFGKAIESFVNAVGAAATNVSGSRQYLAYERGTVDGGMTGILSVSERKLHQVLDHLTLTHHADIEFLVLINDRVWQGLDNTQQSILTKAAVTVEAALRESFAALEAAALAEAEAEGMTIYRPSTGDLAAWRAATAGMRDSYVDTAGPLGAELLAAADQLRARIGED